MVGCTFGALMEGDEMRATNWKPTFRDPDAAFESAIRRGRLSEDERSRNYAGRYMYMFTDEHGKDMFKNCETRRYDV